ncbi:GNAT family N-acetyltransferase [Pseudonocardia humida]|uniref:GNAT family N-acetyltransferase n=1 Tax=Pseudonocardia humida TaxID=2800819 RepID=A0ABT1A8V9_9PSEU|nr:GNAT family N-acetyltransferase [Pseudonocardia humida]MCO1659477.1 GNAT family N-acetyltransferase [Pseudonocardia humida]
MWRLSELDLRDDRIAREVHQLGLRSYAVEAELIGHPGIPALSETLDELRAAPLSWLGAVHDALPVGFLAWIRSPAGELDLVRLCVDPPWFRRGIARRLLDHVLAAEAGGDVLISTGAANEPALRLYRSLGFVETGTHEPEPGLRVTELRLAR